MIKIGNNISEFSVYSCQPKTRSEFIDIIDDRISKDGPNCDLNDIDTSLITDMSYLFSNSLFNGDISKWNVSKVKDMRSMFEYSYFKHDVSSWKINSKCNVFGMFTGCPIKEEYKPKTLKK